MWLNILIRLFNASMDTHMTRACGSLVNHNLLSTALRIYSSSCVNEGKVMTLHALRYEAHLLGKKLMICWCRDLQESHCVKRDMRLIFQMEKWQHYGSRGNEAHKQSACSSKTWQTDSNCFTRGFSNWKSLCLIYYRVLAIGATSHRKSLPNLHNKYDPQNLSHLQGPHFPQESQDFHLRQNLRSNACSCLLKRRTPSRLGSFVYLAIREDRKMQPICAGRNLYELSTILLKHRFRHQENCMVYSKVGKNWAMSLAWVVRLYSTIAKFFPNTPWMPVTAANLRWLDLLHKRTL